MDSTVIAETPSLPSTEVKLSHVVGVGASAGGLDALEQFFDNMPVDIAVTAYSMRGDIELFLSEGFDGYVSKPLITQELIVEIKRVMGLSGEVMEEIHGYSQTL